MDRPPEEVVTARLALRVWRVEDAPALARAIDESREHLEPWMPWARDETSVADSERFILESRERWARGGDATYGVFAGGEVVGGALLSARHGAGVRDVGYWVHAAHAGRGYASELSAALTDAAFALEGVERVEIRHDRANARSRAVPARLGFRLVAELPGERLTPGDEGVDCVWSVGREEWCAARGDD